MAEAVLAQTTSLKGCSEQRILLFWYSECLGGFGRSGEKVFIHMCALAQTGKARHTPVEFLQNEKLKSVHCMDF